MPDELIDRRARIARRVDRGAQGSRDRVPHAHRILLGARLRAARRDDLLLRVGLHGRGRERSRAWRAVGDLHLRRAARTAALVRQSNSPIARSTDCSARRSSRESIYLGKALANLVFVCGVLAVTLPAVVLFYNLPLDRGVLRSVGCSAARGDRSRGGRHAVQRDGREHAHGRAVAADAQPSVLRADRDGGGAGVRAS